MTDSFERLAPAILLLLIALVLVRAGVGLVRFLRRRRSLRAFAAAHGWACCSGMSSRVIGTVMPLPPSSASDGAA